MGLESFPYKRIAQPTREIREKAALLKFCNNYGPTIPLKQLPRDLNGTVPIKQSRTLADAIGVARLIEEWNSLYRGTEHFSQPPPISVMQPLIPNSYAGILGPPPKANQTANANTPPPI
ncbi:hypothetical protein WN943_003161 [Citrus x changshan-huyou]